MAKASSGVFQLPNGMWGFRYAYWQDGKQRDFKRTKDETGKPFKTEKAATKAREALIQKLQTETFSKHTKKRVAVAEVYEEYCEKGRFWKSEFANKILLIIFTCAKNSDIIKIYLEPC